MTMKKTSRSAIPLMLYACAAVCATEEVVFEVQASNAQVARSKADAYANTIIRDRAYMSLTTEDYGQDCWKAFLLGRDITIQVAGSSIKSLSRSDSTYSYQFSFDPNKIEVKDVTQSELQDFCLAMDTGSGESLTRKSKQDAPDSVLEEKIKVNILFDDKKKSSEKPGMPASITSEDTELEY